MNYFYAAVVFIVLAFASQPLWADRYDHHYYPAPEVTYVTEVTEVYQTFEITETVSATEAQVAEAILNSTTLNTYTPDECQGVAIAQAGANNQLYNGSSAVQASLGLGECGGEFGSSLMIGMKVNNNMMLSGSWATDEKVNAYGVGLWLQFK